MGLGRTSVAFDLGLFCVSDREKERLEIGRAHV